MKASLLPAALLLLIGSATAAEPVMPGRTFQGCRWLVPANQYLFQPRTLAPDEVARKNAGGCLSPLDAVYSPDGCPLRFCNYQDSSALPDPAQLMP